MTTPTTDPALVAALAPARDDAWREAHDEFYDVVNIDVVPDSGQHGVYMHTVDGDARVLLAEFKDALDADRYCDAVVEALATWRGSF